MAVHADTYHQNDFRQFRPEDTMRLKTFVSVALLMVVIGVTTAACGNMKPDPNPFGYVDSRRDS